MGSDTTPNGEILADEIARRRGRIYPAHQFIAENFPDYMDIIMNKSQVVCIIWGYRLFI